MVEVNDKVIVAPLYGQKDNIAVITGPAGAGAVLNEGNYNTWTLEWEKPITDNLDDTDHMDLFIDDKNALLYLSWEDFYLSDWTKRRYRFGCYNLADFSVVFESPPLAYYTNSYASGSIKEFVTQGYCELGYGGISVSLQTYLLLQRTDAFTNEIWREGTKIWSRDCRNDTAFGSIGCPYGAISTTGKYVIFQIREYIAGHDNFHLMLYKGSYV